MRIQLQNVAALWSNPVVVRDMRVRMRGSRAFWNQAMYLGVLSLIAVAGYEGSTNSHMDRGLDPVAAQRSLQQFYYWIFVCLAILISLIAPALTAVAVISERKLQTMDLLVTTPMTSMQMLTGKLVSSLAFIMLLLALSIPASALCVILGGATLTDVLQTYLLLAIDGVLLSAIGLSFSCSANQHMQAIVGTYASIIFLFVLTYFAAIPAFGSIVGRASALPAISTICELNPFFAAIDPGAKISILGLDVPGWLAAAIACFLFVRLLLTRAALRLGMYGVGLIGSLRRQILFTSFIVCFLIGQALSQTGSIRTTAIGEDVICGLAIAIFVVSSFFLPALFIPVGDVDGPPNQVVGGSFDLRKMFSVDHGGSFPFYLVWLLCALGGSIAGMLLPTGPTTGFGFGMTMPPLPPPILSWRPLMYAGTHMYVYLAGVGFLYWSITRRSAWFSASAGFAQPFAFFLLAFILFVPIAAMLVENQINTSYNAFQMSWIRYTWLCYPFNGVHSPRWPSMYLYAGVCFVLGTIVYPFWWSVMPGSRAYVRTNQAEPGPLTRQGKGGG
jgi:ABC-2 type transport system permease protein